MFKNGLILFTLFLLVACAIPVKHDPTSYVVDSTECERTPKICKYAYERTDTTVAVANFVNNTTFEVADVSKQSQQGEMKSSSTEKTISKSRKKHQSRKDTSSSVSISQQVQRKIDAKLCASVEESVRDTIVNLGGIKLYARKDLNKVFSELQFQQSGLVEGKQLAKVRMKGVKYIVTGSINNASLKFMRCPEEKSQDRKSTKSEKADLFLALGDAALQALCKAVEGWSVETMVTVRMIDVESGEIVFSKETKGREHIGQVDNPSLDYDTIVGAVKKAASKSIDEIRSPLAKLCKVRGYIVQTRTSPDGKERSALINLGTKNGLKQNAKLIVYTFQEVRDPLNERNIMCDQVKLPIELWVSEQCQSDKSWVMIKGKGDSAKRVKTGQLVEVVPLEEVGLFQQIGL